MQVLVCRGREGRAPGLMQLERQLLVLLLRHPRLPQGQRMTRMVAVPARMGQEQQELQQGQGQHPFNPLVPRFPQAQSRLSPSALKEWGR